MSSDRAKLSSADERALWRLRDGELSEGDMVALRRRLEAEPALQRRFADMQQLAGGFAAGREQVVTPPADFTARVLRGTRQLQQHPSWREHVLDDGQVLRWCRRILLVAAVLIAAAVVWHSGLLPGQLPESLQAEPDEVQREIDRLDAILHDEGSGGAARGMSAR